MAMHLRSDQYFVEDAHWNEAASRYEEFLEAHQTDRVVLLELGVGFNTPVIIRLPFEKMIREHENWSLIRMNLDEAVVPASFGERAVGINADLAEAVRDMSGCVKEIEAGMTAPGNEVDKK